jgi:hypothetical protein
MLYSITKNLIADGRNEIGKNGNGKGYPPHHKIRQCLKSHNVITIYLWLYSPFLDLHRFFSFLILYTASRTPWVGDQPVARPLPTHSTNRHLCLEWDSNP